MSRTRNAVKVRTDNDQPSEWAGLPILKQRQLATFGEKRSERAETLLNEIGFAIQLENGNFETQPWPGVSNPTDYEREKRCQHNHAWELFSKAFWRAVEARDGSLFREMADILELAAKPLNEKRDAFLLVVQICKSKNLSLPTPRKMIDLMNVYLARFQKTANFTDVRRFESYFGVRLPRS